MPEASCAVLNKVSRFIRIFEHRGAFQTVIAITRLGLINIHRELGALLVERNVATATGAAVVLDVPIIHGPIACHRSLCVEREW